jgi:hypothetical protein
MYLCVSHSFGAGPTIFLTDSCSDFRVSFSNLSGASCIRWKCSHSLTIGRSEHQRPLLRPHVLMDATLIGNGIWLAVVATGRSLARRGMRDSERLARSCDGSCLYLDKLIRVAENRDTNKCARRVIVAESGSDFIPRRS